MIARVGAALATGSMLLLAGIYATAATRVATIARSGSLAVLASSGAAPATPDFRVPVADAQAALALDPVNQRLVNIAMLAVVRERLRQPGAAWFAALAQLGWRDTASRQNLLIRHAMLNDIPAVLDDADGLLRRNQLINELGPVLLAMEADPVWQPRLIDRLRRQPAWRFGFLQRGSLLDDPGQLAARARTLRLLQRSGDKVDMSEIAPVLPRLLAVGLGGAAFAVWQTYEPNIARPVADPGFGQVTAEREPSTVPFHWQLTSGPDYSVDAVPQPSPHLAIAWNGAGAPVFAVQYLSAPMGRYRVVLTSPVGGPPPTAIVGVRAVCGNDSVDFEQTRQLSLTRTAYAADRPVPCAFPRLELFGRTGGTSDGGAGDRQADISGVAILPPI